MIYQKGKKWHCEGVVIFYRKTLEKSVGFVASKKVGNAVKRAKAKRRLRAIFLQWQEKLTCGTYVLIAKPRLIDMTYEELDKNLKWSFKKMGLLK